MVIGPSFKVLRCWNLADVGDKLFEWRKRRIESLQLTHRRQARQTYSNRRKRCSRECSLPLPRLRSFVTFERAPPPRLRVPPYRIFLTRFGTPLVVRTSKYSTARFRRMDADVHPPSILFSCSRPLMRCHRCCTRCGHHPRDKYLLLAGVQSTALRWNIASPWWGSPT